MVACIFLVKVLPIVRLYLTSPAIVQDCPETWPFFKSPRMRVENKSFPRFTVEYMTERVAS